MKKAGQHVRLARLESRSPLYIPPGENGPAYWGSQYVAIIQPEGQVIGV